MFVIVSSESYTLMVRDVEVLIEVEWYPVDGFQCRVNVYDTEEERWICGYDKRVIADSFWEGLGGVLCETLDWDWEQADSQLADWGIFAPEDEEV